jgi:hypothetical protein
MIMKTKNLFNSILIILMISLITFSCDTDGEETMSWKPGTGLHIVGPDELEIGEEGEYYVDGFTIDETYTWTLDGTPVTPIRDGEFVLLEFNEADDHVLTVSNGTYTGTIDISVN